MDNLFKPIEQVKEEQDREMQIENNMTLHKKELYYSPDFSEFHPGFEYERNDLKGEFINWYNKVCVGWDFNEIQMMLSNPDPELRDLNNRIRVKYLDNIDIKELGWKDNIIEIEDDKYKQYIRIKLEGKHTKIEVSTHEKGVRYFAPPPYSIIFVGVIKNKSELKKLMKQLDIL